MISVVSLYHNKTLLCDRTNPLMYSTVDLTFPGNNKVCWNTPEANDFSRPACCHETIGSQCAAMLSTCRNRARISFLHASLHFEIVHDRKSFHCSVLNFLFPAKLEIDDWWLWFLRASVYWLTRSVKKFTSLQQFQPPRLSYVLTPEVLMFTSRVREKWLVCSYEFLSQVILVAFGPGTGRSFLELGNKLSFDQSKLCSFWRGCFFSIVIQLQNYFCTTVKLLRHSAASSQTSLWQVHSSRLGAEIHPSFPIKTHLHAGNPLCHGLPKCPYPRQPLSLKA